MAAIRLTGSLLANARTATGADGSAWLVVHIGQGGSSLAAEARHRMGSGAAAQYAAANAAHHLHAGSRVTVHARGWDVLRGAVPHLMLIGVEMIERHDLHPRHEATERDEPTAGAHA